VGLVYTIGYEGASIEQFVQTLKAVGITMLADVRAVPVSRKKGFSKSALRARLEEESIGYIHFVELGDPKPGRDAAKAGQLDTFRRVYSRHLRKNESESALRSLVELVSNQPTCLLCFERDPVCCHRSLIANHPTMSGAKIIHLVADDPSRYARHAAILSSYGSRQGAPAT
jgi:uncharacterized protein (DUF488 family)